MKIESYSVCKDGLKWVCKRPVIMGYYGVSGIPLCYLQKPKWMSDEQFQIIVNGIQLTISDNIEWEMINNG